MTLSFRNVDASPEDPVESWPAEAVRTALERGSLRYWHRLAEAIRSDPWGPTARAVEEVLSNSRPYGVAELMEQVIGDARRNSAARDRAEVAAEVRALLEASGATREEMATRMGTSKSRLSTYLSGKVTPSAALLVRMRRVSATLAAGSPAGRPPGGRM